MRMGEASGLPEMLGALAIDVRAAQSDVAQHAVIELQEQVSAPRPFPPTLKLAQQVRHQSARSRGSGDVGQTIRRKAPPCIDTISMQHRVGSFISNDQIQILIQNDSSTINLSP